MHCKYITHVYHFTINIPVTTYNSELIYQKQQQNYTVQTVIIDAMKYSTVIYSHQMIKVGQAISSLQLQVIMNLVMRRNPMNFDL